LRRGPCGSPRLRRLGVVPVVTTGLHCGKAAARSVRSARLRSSPSSRRGSIAATVAGRSLGRRRRSSPSSRRGSIAARSSPRCSALVARVVPVVTTGLHCGVLSSPSMRAVRACRPRRHDGAPLRPRPAPRPARQTTWSSPSSRTGLHCGAMLTDEATRQGIVVPVVTTGLHCGVMDAAATRRLGVRRPRRHDGAPLRRRPDRNVVRRAGARSSPSSRRGSIAAMESPHEHLA